MYIASGKLILPEIIVNWPFETERVYTEFAMRRSNNENKIKSNLNILYIILNLSSLRRIADRLQQQL